MTINQMVHRGGTSGKQRSLSGITPAREKCMIDALNFGKKLKWNEDLNQTLVYSQAFLNCREKPAVYMPHYNLRFRNLMFDYKAEIWRNSHL